MENENTDVFPTSKNIEHINYRIVKDVKVCKSSNFSLERDWEL
jgi:hypothetical protein